MDWRERTYYWVRLNNSGAAWFEKGHDSYGKEYERRVKELKKIPGLRMHPLPSMALDREKREKVPEWAQMLVSCRKAHEGTLKNCFVRFAAEAYGNCMWGRIVEPVKAWLTREKREMKGEVRKLKVGDKVRILDGSGATDYICGWAPGMEMKQYVGKTRTIEKVSYDGKAIRLVDVPYVWDSRYLELVEEAKGEETMKKTIKEIKVRNRAGILKITAERELNLRDVFSGIGDDKLPTMPNPRLEIHQGPYGNVLVTLTDRTADNTMFLAEIEDGIPPRIYVGHYEPEKRAEDYVTFEPWREG